MSTYHRISCVDRYFNSLPSWQQNICRRVRGLVHAIDPDVTPLRLTGSGFTGPAWESPSHSYLILTHILQTELNRKVNACEKRLQSEPAFPEGSPSRRPVMGACQIATETCHLPPESAQRHGARRLSRALSHHRQQQRLNHLVSWALWFSTHKGSELQQAHGKWGQQPQQAYQTINRLHLPFFNATATFEALGIVFDWPPMSLPVHALPPMFECDGGHRSQQEPFQWLLSFWDLLFPDADDPDRQGCLAHSWLLARRQECHLPKGKLELGRTPWMPMSGWQRQRFARPSTLGPTRLV